LWVAQGPSAHASGVAPETLAPGQFFSRMATASLGLRGAELALREMPPAKPGLDWQQPAWRRAFAWTTWEGRQVEPRNGRRRKRRVCQRRQQWKSFPHIPSGKKLT
jgi:hypothetical protein